MDLYYDPVVDEHVRTPVGLIAPTWYLAPQRREVAETAWRFGASVMGLLGDGDVGMNDARDGLMLAWFTGEFADGAIKEKLWEACDTFFEPTQDPDSGEFTFGFGLGEIHPRGQFNARVMAGWVCQPGAWAQIFDNPNLAKHSQPCVERVDFPRVAMSQAHWNEGSLHLAADPCNGAANGTRTTMTIRRLPTDGEWILKSSDETLTSWDVSGGSTQIELIADGSSFTLTALDETVSA
ncbi:MAG: hypothetical protein VYB10_04960 [Actinomycetota bacterium]|nr:hypothetical protein [Actinomycetota bacterium]